MLIPERLVRQMAHAAERAYPEECCGLLIGHGDDATAIAVTGVAASRNVAKGRERDRFEVDPEVRFDLMRALEGGRDRIVGHYHSHPDHPARPSARDAEMAWEPDPGLGHRVGGDGRAGEVRAHVLEPGLERFREIPLHCR